MLLNAFPALLFVTNLCTMDKIGHLFKSNSWFQHCASYQKEGHYKKEKAQLTFKMLKTEDSCFGEKHFRGNLQADKLNSVLF